MKLKECATIWLLEGNQDDFEKQIPSDLRKKIEHIFRKDFVKFFFPHPMLLTVFASLFYLN